MNKNLQKYEKFLVKSIIPLLHKTSGKLTLLKKIKSRSKTKDQFDPVTTHDISLQKKIITEIVNKFPNHGIEGEEGSSQKINKKIKWVIDPIDGTKSFLIGMPTYSNLIGLQIEKKFKLGLAYFPVLKKHYLTKKKKSYVFLNGSYKKIKTSNIKDLKQSKMVINTLRTIKNNKYLKFFKSYKNFFKITGADAYNYCRLAEGDIDIIFESKLKPFDIKPLIPIIINSGGVISDWTGKKYKGSGDILVASNKVLHKKFLQLIKKKTK